MPAGLSIISLIDAPTRRLENRHVTHLPTPRTPFDSSSIKAAGYSADASTLEIEFQNGATYKYFEVPPAVFQAFLAAESKGRYFNTVVRGAFIYQRGG
mgnify:CR=1 FL=1